MSPRRTPCRQAMHLDRLVDQRLGASKIMSLAWRKHQRDGIAQGIDERVNFGGQSTARSAIACGPFFFRAPALC